MLINVCSRYDIRCVTASGHRYLVEMQKGEQRHFLERSQYYVSRGVAEQGYRGMCEGIGVEAGDEAVSV